MIRLRSLKLENFLSHRNTELNFDDEAYVIVGENASGKTSILRGVFFSLFGKDFSISATERLVNREATRFYVELSFQKGRDLFTVKRGYSALSRKSKAEIYKNGKLYASGVRQVQRVISEELMLDPLIFRRTVYVPQGEIVEFLNQQRKEKRQILNRLLGLDEIAGKFDAIKRFYKNLSNAIELFESKLMEYMRLEEKKNELLGEIASKERELQVKKELLEKEAGLLAKQEKLYQDFIERRERYAQLFRRLKEKEKERENLNATAVRYRNLISELEAHKKRLPGLEEAARLLPKVKEIRDILDKIIELKRRVAELEKEKVLLSELRERITSLEEELPKILGELDAKREKLRTLKDKHSEVLEKLNLVREKVDKFKTLRASYSAFQERLESLISELSLVSSASDSVSALEGKKRALSREIEGLEKRAFSLRARCQELSNKLEVLREKKDACPICGSPLPEEKRESLVSEIEKELFQIEREREKLQGELADKTSSLESIERELKAALLDLQRCSQLEKEKGLIEKKLSELSTELDSLRGLDKEFNVLNEEEDALKRRISSLEAHIRFLEGRKKEVERELDRRRGLYFKEREEALEREVSELSEKIEKLKEKAASIRDALGIDVHSVPEVNALLAELEAKARELSAIRGELKNLPFYFRELATVEKRIEEEEKSFTALRKEIEALGFDEKLFQSAREAYEVQKRRIQDIRSEVSRLEGELKALKRAKEELEREILEGRSVVGALTKLLDVKRVLEGVLVGFHPEKGFLKDVRKYLLPQIAIHCREFFEEFNFELGDVEISEDLTVTFGSNGGDHVQVEEFSGGQQIAFALSLRFAMARYFSQNFELLMLDEPTIHLDQVRKQALTDLLMRLKSRIPQMFVVTHDAELEVIGDRVIRVSGERGFSEVSVD